MNDDQVRSSAREQLRGLVAKYEANLNDYLRPTYQEAQVRTDFISPLLENVFGWDVSNQKRLPPGLREVVEEATVEVGSERQSKKPDYELRLARERKLFVEAKKPNVKIELDRTAAFQVRRYGFSANLPISVLTNFNHIAIYDCRHAPSEHDEAHVARIAIFSYADFEDSLEVLWGFLARAFVYSGEFDRRYGGDDVSHVSQPFDSLFLRQVRDWRMRLAVDLHANNPELDSSELTFAVQLFLSRLVFLRICEDREIEKYETLKSLGAEDTFQGLMAIIAQADKFYDSGLFRLLADERLELRITDSTLYNIITELYYPQSPYTFAVVETEVLGSIYEQFLGEALVVEGNQVRIEVKPEIRASGGVVPTPRYIVDDIVSRTLAPAIADKSPDELEGFTVADICCGSGVFLLSSYECLLEHYLSWYLANDSGNYIGRTIEEAVGGKRRLTFDERVRILLEHVRGVDIDSSAVEVAQFSLLLKLIEDETPARLLEYVMRNRRPALPSLDKNIRMGNSLVSYPEWTSFNGNVSDGSLEQVRPFTWSVEFPAEFDRGGFDVIVGNPPYVRIQRMTAYSRAEVEFYQSESSPYATAHQGLFDKFELFVERSLTLLRTSGRLGLIVPNKFMTKANGRVLRRLISSERFLQEVVHFGVKQVFPGRATYTCILIFDRRGQDRVQFEPVGQLEKWRYGERGPIQLVAADELSEDPWVFPDVEVRKLMDRIRITVPDRLGNVAAISVGLQTSADDIYVINSHNETANTIAVKWDGKEWPIERGILRPLLYKFPLAPYARPIPNSWLIFPYVIDEAQGKRKVRLIQPSEMAARFPGCWDYFNARRKELEKRQISGGPKDDLQWYQFGRSQSLDKFGSPKIIVYTLSREARYAYDDNDSYVTGGGNGPYYMIRALPGVGVSNFYLLALLNHPLSEAFIRTQTSAFRGGYYSHGKQYIEGIPVPIPSSEDLASIDALVGDLLDVLDRSEAASLPAHRSMLKGHAKHLHTQIENCVTSIYGLSLDDVARIESVSIPN